VYLEDERGGEGKKRASAGSQDRSTGLDATLGRASRWDIYDNSLLSRG